jgi:hypothetical protein
VVRSQNEKGERVRAQTRSDAIIDVHGQWTLSYYIKCRQCLVSPLKKAASYRRYWILY